MVRAQKKPTSFEGFLVSGRQDSNLRPPGPKPGALPACATSRIFLTAVRAGFEPAVQFNPYGSLANY